MKNVKHLLSGISISLGFLALLSSCEQKGPHGETPDTPVQGHIKIDVDESLKPFGYAEATTFMQIYDKAKLDVKYASAVDAVNDLHTDSARMIILPRPLTDAEMQQYKAKGTAVKMIKLAYDAIALIVNNKNADSTLTTGQLAGIMSGKISNWQQLGKGSGPIQVVFDNSGSSTLQYMKERFHLTGSLPSNFSAVNTNEEVISYVEKNPQSLGFIGVSWISNDADDTSAHAFVNRIKVLKMNPPDTAKGATFKFYPPAQAYIGLGYYPLVREIYGITPEFFNGLGSGFITFMANDKGQITAHRIGLVPVTESPRRAKLTKGL